MTTYRKLHGKAVKTVTTNPTDDAAEGQIWFNSTDNKFKSAVAGEAWVTSSNMNTGRSAVGHGSATQTAGLVFGGYSDPNYLANSEEYNGSGFSVAENLPAARGWIMGAGTQTAAIGIGGFYPGPTANTTVYNYNGTSWSTNPHSLPSGVAEGGSAGTQTSAIIFAGRPPNPPVSYTHLRAHET